VLLFQFSRFPQLCTLQRASIEQPAEYAVYANTRYLRRQYFERRQCNLHTLLLFAGNMINNILDKVIYKKNMSCLVDNISRIVNTIKVYHLGIGWRELLHSLNRRAVCVECHPKILNSKGQSIVKLALLALSGLF